VQFHCWGFCKFVFESNTRSCFFFLEKLKLSYISVFCCFRIPQQKKEKLCVTNALSTEHQLEQVLYLPLVILPILSAPLLFVANSLQIIGLCRVQLCCLNWIINVRVIFTFLHDFYLFFCNLHCDFSLYDWSTLCSYMKTVMSILLK